MSINKGFGKINGTWNLIDSCYIKQNGLWVKHPSVHVKRGGDWYKITFAQLPPDVICVSPFGDGDGTGSNWSNAMSFANFRAIAGLTPGKTYFLKKGCYALGTNIPTIGDFENYYYKGVQKCVVATSPYVQLAQNVSIYGGFDGTDNEPMKRYGLFDGIQNRTLFFEQDNSSGTLFSVIIDKNNMDHNVIIVDNIDVRKYCTASDKYLSAVGLKYINFSSSAYLDASGLDLRISRITSNSVISSGTLTQQLPETGLPVETKVSYDSCIRFGTTSSSSGTELITPARNPAGAYPYNASLVTRNCIFIYKPYSSNCFFNKAEALYGYRDKIHIYHINDTILTSYSYSTLNGHVEGVEDREVNSYYNAPRANAVNTIYVKIDESDLATLLYRNGDYSAPFYSSYRYRENYCNSIVKYPGTASAGSVGNYNTLGLVTNRNITDLLAGNKTLNAFITNEEALITVAGYSDAITTPGAYGPGTVLGDCNASVPTVDITGYARPSGVMTLGAWTYR